MQALDAVQNGSVECAHTTSFFYTGKNEAFAIGTGLPFGLNTRQQNAWMYEGGGIELMNELYRKFNVHGLPLGATGAQMGGWFRREVNTAADLQGLKMRIGGLAGQVLQRLGGVPQQLGAADLYPSLERGTIDAVEWLGPYDDEKLGFFRVARFYYYPAWWEGAATTHLFVNLDQWNALPRSYQAAMRTACAEATHWMVARYDTRSPEALRRLVAQGTQLRPFSREMMDACLAWRSTSNARSPPATRISRASTNPGPRRATRCGFGTASPNSPSTTTSAPPPRAVRRAGSPPSPRQRRLRRQPAARPVAQHHVAAMRAEDVARDRQPRARPRPFPGYGSPPAGGTAGTPLPAPPPECPARHPRSPAAPLPRAGPAAEAQPRRAAIAQRVAHQVGQRPLQRHRPPLRSTSRSGPS